METYEQLFVRTSTLLKDIDHITEIFEKTKASNKRGDFYTEVKPFADEMKGKKEEWEMMAIQWIEETRPKHLFRKQIESASEQIELLSVQAFYPDTGRTRFVNYVQSVRYILTGMIDEIEKNKKAPS